MLKWLVCLWLNNKYSVQISCMSFFFLLFNTHNIHYLWNSTRKKKKVYFLFTLQREERLWQSAIRVWKKTGSEVGISVDLAVRTAPLPLGHIMTASTENNTGAEVSGVAGMPLTGDVCVCVFQESSVCLDRLGLSHCSINHTITSG